MVSEENYAKVCKELIAKGIEIDENDEADFCLTERNKSVNFLIGKKDDLIYRLKTKDILYIESFGHDVYAVCGNDSYKINERLFRLESMLENNEFIRISNSVIVSVSHIKSIKPSISQKFILTMTNGKNVDVTRTYYYKFKEFLGI